VKLIYRIASKTPAVPEAIDTSMKNPNLWSGPRYYRVGEANLDAMCLTVRENGWELCHSTKGGRDMQEKERKLVKLMRECTRCLRIFAPVSFLDNTATTQCSRIRPARLGGATKSSKDCPQRSDKIAPLQRF
jgi:hypothetical protein